MMCPFIGYLWNLQSMQTIILVWPCVGQRGLWYHVISTECLQMGGILHEHGGYYQVIDLSHDEHTWLAYGQSFLRHDCSDEAWQDYGHISLMKEFKDTASSM
jgi:hypothetical protein